MNEASTADRVHGEGDQGTGSPLVSGDSNPKDAGTVPSREGGTMDSMADGDASASSTGGAGDRGMDMGPKPSRGDTAAVRNMVVMKSIKKVYGDIGDQVTALKGINLFLPEGSVTAIMGPSGSGKSTLINLIGSLDIPTDGEISVNGVNLEHMTPRELTAYRREGVGFVFQTFNLLPNLTARENVELPMEFMGIDAGERREQAMKLLRAVKLDSRSDHVPGALSGGERQRVAIARALANNPPLILADEPTGNLDSRTGKDIINLLKSVSKNRNKTLVIVTHDMKVAEMADRIVYLEDGRIQGIEDVGDTNSTYMLSREFDIPLPLIETLFGIGYDTIEKLVGLSEAELLGTNVKKKERRIIMERIGRYRNIVSRNVCHECNREIYMQGVSFCPFCGKALPS